MKVALIGAAGGIGQPLAALLKMFLPAGAELALYDLVPATPGIGVDVSHIPTQVSVRGYVGEEQLTEALAGADMIMITAGVARKPGMAREDLLKINADIVAHIVRVAANNAPNAVILIGTNPVNSIIPLAARVLEHEGCYNPAKLFGATMLDTVRAASFILEHTGVSVKLSDIPIVCGHSDKTIVPLLSSVHVLQDKPEVMNALYTRIAGAGTEVVHAKAGAGSATLSMAYATYSTIMTIIDGLNGATDAVINTYVGHERYGLSFFAQPVRIGRDGAEEFLPIPEPNAVEKNILEQAIKQLDEDIAAAMTVSV